VRGGKKITQHIMKRNEAKPLMAAKPDRLREKRENQCIHVKAPKRTGQPSRGSFLNNGKRENNGSRFWAHVESGGSDNDTPNGEVINSRFGVGSPQWYAFRALPRTSPLAPCQQQRETFPRPAPKSRRSTALPPERK